MEMIEEIKICSPSDCENKIILDIIKALLSLIPEGRVIAYSELSKMIGLNPRKLGFLLSLNEEYIIYPCHRVVRKDGKLGGYRGNKENKMKEILLKIEGIRINNGKVERTHFIFSEDLI